MIDGSQARVLIVEDEEDIALGLRRTLESIGCVVDVATDGATGLERATSETYELVVVDLLLPKLNGFKLCARMRAAGVLVPVLVLTAKTGELDEAESLDSGADDFLTKPVSTTILIAHVRALLRRYRQVGARHLSCGDLHLDMVRHEARLGSSCVGLSARESEVLAHLMLQHGSVVSKADLMRAVWGPDFPGSPNIVEVYVRHLRRKLADRDGHPVIETVWGSGYRLCTIHQP